MKTLSYIILGIILIGIVTAGILSSRSPLETPILSLEDRKTLSDNGFSSDYNTYVNGNREQLMFISGQSLLVLKFSNETWKQAEDRYLSNLAKKLKETKFIEKDYVNLK